MLRKKQPNVNTTIFLENTIFEEGENLAFFEREHRNTGLK